MTDENIEGPEAPFTVTLKGGAGFEAPWLVLRATSAEDAVALLGEAVMAELPEKIAEFAADFRAKAGAGAPSATGAQRGGSSPSQVSAAPRGRRASSGASAPQRQQARQQDDVEYHPEGLQCDECGEPIRLKAGTSKAGRAYEVWTCPNQARKGDGHFSQYV